MANTSFFIGRFQPFHNGHLSVLKGMVKVSDKVIVGIGSSEKHGNPENPFTSGERREMIQRALQEVNVIPMYDVSFVDLPDMEEDEAWAKMCLELCENQVTKVWTGNEWTKKCFENTDVEIQNIKEVPGISSTEVRHRIAAGKSWEDLVPKAVAEYVKDIDGVSRVKKI
ncbi:TPA: nicotinamide-nucleotide adenylyltransferase [Candidatus Uhrbacteria bacterium]|nr:nicotinamide-nucleotide adenylyltransferase [Candidatus Uhrbacteria bacterium]HCU32105.1 nicotinamide-nucleotide adenylyltransferase [Candidatus Uhrbacteria bacterium]